jgi:hypothetical protein
MGIKIGPKRRQKNTILTQLKNVQINVQEFCLPIFFKKSHIFKTNIFVTIHAANRNFLKN